MRGLLELLIIGIPESFLFVFAIYTFTGIRFSVKKYLVLSFAFTFIVFATRWLPISLGAHTMLCLLLLILLFLFTNRVNLQAVIRSIVSAIVIAIYTIISEALNVLLLIGVLGKSRTDKLLSGDSLLLSVSELPSTLFLAMLILITYFVLKKIEKNKKDTHGGTFQKNRT